MAEFNIILDNIKSGKIKYNAKAADEFRRINKVGEYREWEIDFKRIEEIEQLVKRNEAHMHPSYHEYHQTRKLENG